MEPYLVFWSVVMAGIAALFAYYARAVSGHKNDAGPFFISGTETT